MRAHTGCWRVKVGISYSEHVANDAGKQDRTVRGAERCPDRRTIGPHRQDHPAARGGALPTAGAFSAPGNQRKWGDFSDCDVCTDNNIGKKLSEGGQTKYGWRYENPDNLAEKVINGRTMKWCTKDCHRRPQWCGRRNCLDKAEYAEAMKRKNEKGSPMPEGGKVKISKDYKMALAALTTSDDYQTLEDQFFSIKD